MFIKINFEIQTIMKLNKIQSKEEKEKIYNE